MSRSYSPKLDRPMPISVESISYTDVAHFKELGKMFHGLRENDELCDITLLVNDKTIKAHKIILSAASPYFKAMFTGGLSECDKNCITMHQIDGNSLVQIIQFFYTSEMKINKENVQNLLSAASLLQVSSVLDGCCEFFKRNLSDDNCLEHQG
ncbi:kelch-like protein diablo [Xenia sp. Carnegie-2017]|uniref:kelch-like protein diablo n=1 Tax=Xenia sp. Carnegie-2017 TaxID=2897299 RepID=UPI001F038EE6|nr:kelch-like protein diablo [Xenia sp. Carnegie-2017]